MDDESNVNEGKKEGVMGGVLSLLAGIDCKKNI
jgi:hypothetical protein